MRVLQCIALKLKTIFIESEKEQIAQKVKQETITYDHTVKHRTDMESF